MTPKPASDDEIRQRSRRAEFIALGSTPWTVVADGWSADGGHGGYLAYWSDPRDRDRVVGGFSWTFQATDGKPRFMQTFRGGRKRTRYLRFGTTDGEPLVIARNFSGVRPTYVEVCEEFRHFHDLYDLGDGRFVKILEDGSELDAIEISGRTVRIRTSLLRQFQAARQLDLVFQVDSIAYFPDSDVGDSLTWREEVGTVDSCWAFNVVDDLDGAPYSRFCGKRVLTPPPRKNAGVWPFETKDDHFPEFIIGIDEAGAQLKFTCDPDQLANYFGANADAPNYLTPVHFSRDVLRRYYDKPELFSVEDGYLRCQGLWGVSIDNDHTDQVVMFLGDIGRDLPARERDHWSAHNVAPSAPMSETAFRRSFLA